MATSAPPARPSSSSPSGGFGSIPLGPRHRGRCRPMRQCLQDDGCTSSRWWLNPLDEALPRWPSTLVARATRRPDSWPIRCFARATPGWAAALLIIEDYIFPEYTASRRPSWSNRVLAVFRTIVAGRGGTAVLAWLRPHVQQLWRSLVFDRKGAADRQPRVSRLAVAADPAGAALLRVLELLRRPHPYELPAGRIHRFGVAAARRTPARADQALGRSRQVRLAPRTCRSSSMLTTTASPISTNSSASCSTGCGGAAFWTEPG